MEKKYTLPRHTVLAKQSSRIGAFLIDFGAFSVLCFLLFTFVFSFVVKEPINKHQVILEKYEVDSHLVVKTENGTEIIKSGENSDTTPFENALKYFYFTYLTGEGIDESVAAPNHNDPITLDDGSTVSKSSYYTIEWYNKNVLDITDDSDGKASTSYFTYKKDSDGNPIKNEFGIRKEETYSTSKEMIIKLTNEDFAAYFANVYMEAYSVLQKQNFFLADYTPMMFLNTVKFTAAVLLAGLITYVIIPYFAKNDATVGKMVLHLGLANSDGYKTKKYQLLFRFVPFFVVACSFLFPYYPSIVVPILIILAIFLTSFSFYMASPKMSSLHDIVARTIVVDELSSIIFDNSMLEEEYCLKEEEPSVATNGNQN